MIMTDETWYLVRNTRGCTGFLGQDKSGGSKPLLTEEEIIAMGVEKREIEVNYALQATVFALSTARWQALSALYRRLSRIRTR